MGRYESHMHPWPGRVNRFVGLLYFVRISWTWALALVSFVHTPYTSVLSYGHASVAPRPVSGPCQLLSGSDLFCMYTLDVSFGRWACLPDHQCTELSSPSFSFLRSSYVVLEYAIVKMVVVELSFLGPREEIFLSTERMAQARQ